MSCDNIINNNFTPCDCSNSNLESVVQCTSCVYSDCSGQECSYFNKKNIEAQIQNQVRVSESQRLDVFSAFTVSRQRLRNTSEIAFYPYHNLSDRVLPANRKYNNVPTRGNSLRSSITSNRPGSMTPGGSGVDVKYGSYARHLAKIKSKNIYTDSSRKTPPDQYTMNNKQYRFNIISLSNCCGTVDSGS